MGSNQTKTLALTIIVIVLLSCIMLYTLRRRIEKKGRGKVENKPVSLSQPEMICRLVGEKMSGDVGILGADLGIPVTVNQGGNIQIYFLFGDVFSPPKSGSNAIGYVDPPLTENLTINLIQDSEGRYREMWSS